tara:strand:- start:23646 stop:24089 length:444 start_codon:yes stop_codon:yes gene_type:complete
MANPTDSNSRIFQGSTRVGLRNVGSYQVSGHPYVTASVIPADNEMRVQFPYVTKKVTVILSGSMAAASSGLRIHFVSTSSAGGPESIVDRGHYIRLDSHEDSMDFDVKCKELYLSAPGGAAGFQIYASLTNIPTGSMYAMTGSGITE